MLNELIGKRFELSEVQEIGRDNNELMSLTLIGDSEIVRLEAEQSSYGKTPLIAVSIESLVDPPSEEVKTDVFGGNFVAAPL